MRSSSNSSAFGAGPGAEEPVLMFMSARRVTRVSESSEEGGSLMEIKLLECIDEFVSDAVSEYSSSDPY